MTLNTLFEFFGLKLNYEHLASIKVSGADCHDEECSHLKGSIMPADVLLRSKASEPSTGCLSIQLTPALRPFKSAYHSMRNAKSNPLGALLDNEDLWDTRWTPFFLPSQASAGSAKGAYEATWANILDDHLVEAKKVLFNSVIKAIGHGSSACGELDPAPLLAYTSFFNPHKPRFPRSLLKALYGSVSPEIIVIPANFIKEHSDPARETIFWPAIHAGVISAEAPKAWSFMGQACHEPVMIEPTDNAVMRETLIALTEHMGLAEAVTAARAL